MGMLLINLEQTKLTNQCSTASSALPSYSIPRQQQQQKLVLVARADLAETANQRCLSSKVTPAYASMAREAYQYWRPLSLAAACCHLSAPVARTIASEPLVRRCRRSVRYPRL